MAATALIRPLAWEPPYAVGTALEKTKKKKERKSVNTESPADHCLPPPFVFLAISWATPAAYGGSQARGRIGAVATGLRQSHSNAGSEPRLQPTPQTAQGNAGPLTH